MKVNNCGYLKYFFFNVAINIKGFFNYHYHSNNLKIATSCTTFESHSIYLSLYQRPLGFRNFRGDLGEPGLHFCFFTVRFGLQI